MQSPTLAALAARTTNGQSDPITFSKSEDEFAVLVDCTAASGTVPSLAIRIEWSNDKATWFEADSGDTFAAIEAAKRVAKSFARKGLHARVAWTVTGTTPSFTFGVQGHAF